MARDGGRARGLSSRAARGGAADGDHLYCNSARARARRRCVSLSLSARRRVSSFRIFHLSAFTCTSHSYGVSPPRAFTFLPFSTSLFAFHARLRQCTRRRQASRFMRSLSIFHDSLFYCLRESLYPAFPPRGARETLYTRSSLLCVVPVCAPRIFYHTGALSLFRFLIFYCRVFSFSLLRLSIFERL